MDVTITYQQKFRVYAEEVDFVIGHVGCKNFGESSILSPFREKNVLKKRSIDGYVSIFEDVFLSKWAKSGLSLIRSDLLLDFMGIVYHGSSGSMCGW